MLSNVPYFLREAASSFYRNRLLSFATISTVTVCILILGIAVLMSANAGSFMQQLESDVQIIAFIDRSLSAREVDAIGNRLEAMEGVARIDFVSRDQALAKLQETYGGEYDLLETIGTNPLPDSYDIKAKDPHDVPEIARKIEKIPGIYKVNYGEGVVEKLFSVTRGVRLVSIAFIILLASGAVFLISTTIRLAVYSRRKEVYLMKLVGATDWFIRWPFFIEGICLGAVGALIAMGLLAFGYSSLIGNMESVAIIPVVNDAKVLRQIYLSLFGAGALLGVLGTYISVNRFLDV